VPGNTRLTHKLQFLSAELDYTLLKHAGRASNLGALLDLTQLPPLLAELALRLSQKKQLQSLIGKFVDKNQKQPEIDAAFLSKIKNDFKIPPYLYARLLKSLRTNKGPASRTKYVSEYKQRGDFSQHEVPVPTLAQSIHQYKHLGLTYTDLLDKGSSSIEYSVSSNATNPCYGKIHKIFQILLRNRSGKYQVLTFLCVQRLEKLSPQDQHKNLYQALCPNLNVHLFYAPPLLPETDGLRHCDLITPQNIIYHTATFWHDSEKFDTEHSLIAVKSLSGGRQENLV
jgi:hypothetical protein